MNNNDILKANLSDGIIILYKKISFYVSSMKIFQHKYIVH